MNNREVLTKLTKILIIIGAIGIAIPFTLSLLPSEKAKNSLYETDISKLKPGGFIQVDELNGIKVFIIKDWDKTVYAYAIPYKESVGYLMPDIHWWKYDNFLCKNFGPDIVNEKIKKSGSIKCHDKKLHERGVREYIWSYAGKNQGKFTDDLPVPKYVISNQTFKITGYGWH